MAVKTRQDYFNVEIGANTTEIVETSHMVARLTGYPVQYNKAVVGRNAFAHESGIHQHGVLRHRETYEIMDPASVGHRSVLVLGKHSGRAAFADALNKMDITLDDEAFARAFKRFKELADRKGEISEKGLRAIINTQAAVPRGEITLVGIRVSGGHDQTPKASVTVAKGGVEDTFAGEGDGMINATFVALQDAFAVAATLLDYRVNPVTPGADAMAEVNVILQVGSSTFSGRGVSTDVVEGSALAFVAALNKTLTEDEVAE